MTEKQRRRMVMVDDDLWRDSARAAAKLKLSRSALVRIGLRSVLALTEGETLTLRALIEEEDRV